MARLSQYYVSNFDQSKELTLLTATAKDIYHPPVKRESR